MCIRDSILLVYHVILVVLISIFNVCAECTSVTKVHFKPFLLFLASAFWNGVIEAKGSCCASLSECFTDSWRSGHKPPNVPHCSQAAGGCQSSSAHSYPAIQRNAGKLSRNRCNTFRWYGMPTTLSVLQKLPSQKRIICSFVFFFINLFFLKFSGLFS